MRTWSWSVVWRSQSVHCPNIPAPTHNLPKVSVLEKLLHYWNAERRASETEWSSTASWGISTMKLKDLPKASFSHQELRAPSFPGPDICLRHLTRPANQFQDFRDFTAAVTMVRCHHHTEARQDSTSTDSDYSDWLINTLHHRLQSKQTHGPAFWVL